MSPFTFKKEERLKSRKIIAKLFLNGNTIHHAPFRILFQVKEPGKYPATMAVVVPKRLFKRAVDRNLLKRRIRESYRLFKPEFYQLLNRKTKQYNILIIYQKGKLESYEIINRELKIALKNTVFLFIGYLILNPM